MKSNSEKIQNFMRRLAKGVSVKDLSTDDIETVRIIQDGGEFIVLTSDDEGIAFEIEEAIPFCFELVETASGAVCVEIQPDGARVSLLTGKSDDYFILDRDVTLRVAAF